MYRIGKGGGQEGVRGEQVYALVLPVGVASRGTCACSICFD